MPELPYGLNVRQARRGVLRVLWADIGTFSVTEFAGAPWEAEALGL